jgi:hypothetical protein
MQAIHLVIAMKDVDSRRGPYKVILLLAREHHKFVMSCVDSLGRSTRENAEVG